MFGDKQRSLFVDDVNDLDEDGQIDFKAKAFTRTYDFLVSVIPYMNREWERLANVRNLLIPKLPAPLAHDRALAKAMQLLLKDDTLDYKLFVGNVVYAIAKP